MTGAFQRVPAAGLSAAAAACSSLGVDGATVELSPTATTIVAGTDNASFSVRLPGDGTGHGRRSVRTSALHVQPDSGRVAVTAVDGGSLLVDGRTAPRATPGAGRRHTNRFAAGVAVTVDPADLIALLTAVSSHSKSLIENLDGKVHLKIVTDSFGAGATLTATAAGSFAAATTTVAGTLTNGEPTTVSELWLHGPALRAGVAALNARAKTWTVSCGASGAGHRVQLSDGVTDITTVVDPEDVPDIVAPFAAPDRVRCWDFDITDVPALAAFLNRLPAAADGTSPFVQIRNERGTQDLHHAGITAQINGRAVPCVARRSASRGVATRCAEDVAVDVPLVQFRALVATAAAHRASTMVLRGYAPYRTMAKLFAHPTSGTRSQFTAVTVARVPVEA